MSSQTTKKELCLGMRIVSRRKAAAPFLAGHMSCKLANGNFLVNRFGSSFATVTERDLVEVNHNGKIVEGTGEVNATIKLHCYIHQLRPDATAVCHSHPYNTNTFSALRKDLIIYDQESCLLYDDFIVAEKKHASLDTSDSIAQLLSEHTDKHIVLAPNHGCFTIGSSIAWSVLRMLMVEHACSRNLKLLQTGFTAQGISDAAAENIKNQQLSLKAIDAFWLNEVKLLTN